MNRPHFKLPLHELVLELMCRMSGCVESDEFLAAHFGQIGKLMSLSQQILDKVTEADTKVDSVVAFIKGLQAEETITPDVANAILSKLQGSEDKMDEAIGATSNPTATPTPVTTVASAPADGTQAPPADTVPTSNSQ